MPNTEKAQHTPGPVEQQADAFKRWFSSAGHWVYEYRADAVRVLRECGIHGRPRWTAELGAALQSWVDADPLPAIIRGGAIMSRCCRHCKSAFQPKPWQITKSDFECDPCRKARQAAWRATRKQEGRDTET